MGIKFCRSDDDIVMHQRKYELELISKVGLASAKLVSTALETNVKLTSADYDSNSNDSLLYDVGKYQRMVEKLLYLTNTRPDIAFVVQTLESIYTKAKNVTLECNFKGNQIHQN